MEPMPGILAYVLPNDPDEGDPEVVFILARDDGYGMWLVGRANKEVGHIPHNGLYCARMRLPDNRPPLTEIAPFGVEYDGYFYTNLPQLTAQRLQRDFIIPGPIQKPFDIAECRRLAAYYLREE